MTPVLVISSGDVHVWLADLDAVSLPDDVLARGLSEQELARAAGFRHDMHRRRYLASHAFLRRVLARYVRSGVAATGIEFERTPSGKPVMAGPAAAGLHFSLSHAGTFAACAVAGREVGIDIEPEQLMPEAPGIAERIFTPERLARWQGESGQSRAASLLVGWTQFEALAKAQGGGLIDPPARIAMDSGCDCWNSVHDRRAEWSVLSFRGDNRAVVSVAVAGAPGRLREPAAHRG
ncbi:MAG: 4'-phosphopantetheinyl transferase superfamily protein [Gemmatimonadota bacterium]